MHELIPFQRGTPRTLRLPAPQVPNAQTYGGIGALDIADPSKGVIAMAGPWLGMTAGDRIDFYWGDPAVVAASYTVPGDPGTKPPSPSAVTLFIKPADIISTGEGKVKVWYTVTGFPGDETSSSPIIDVLVNFTVPGAPDPIADTETINEGLGLLSGLPRYVQPGESVELVAPPWSNMEAGDVLRLAWGGARVTLTPITEAQRGKPVTIVVDAQTIASGGSGDVVVQYEVRDNVNNWSRWSRRQWSDVDVGDRLPAPLVVAANEHGELDLDALMGKPVDIRVAYEISATRSEADDTRIAIDDTVVLSWAAFTGEGMPLPVHTQSHEVEGPTVPQHLRFEVPYEMAAIAARGSAIAFYSVLPKYGNARSSRRTTVRLVGAAPRLPAPEVLEAVDGVLDPAHAGQGATVQILRHALIRPRSTVRVTFEGTAQDGSSVGDYAEITVRESTPQPLRHVVPSEKIRALSGGSARVRYSVTLGGSDDVLADHPAFESDVLSLRIAGKTAHLPPPRATDFPGDEIDPQSPVIDLHGGLRVTVPAYTGVPGKHYVDLEVTPLPSGLRWTQTRRVETPVERIETLPRAELKDMLDAGARRLQIQYRVSDKDRESESRVYTLKEAPPPLTIDPSLLILNGILFRLENDTPTNPPEGSFAMRTARGGKPPYTYTAMGPEVEVDAHTGSVLAARNGSAVVQVRDSLGTTASYPVLVSGVSYFIDSAALGIYEFALATAAALGGRVPSLDEWQAFRLAYDNQPPAADIAAWTSTSPKPSYHYVIFPRSGTVETNSDKLFPSNRICRKWAVKPSS